MSLSAADLGIPAIFNAAEYFVDRNIAQGHGDRVAIECGDERFSYHDVLAQVNRAGRALRDELGVGPEDRVLLLLLDGPVFVASFFGAMKIGAVPVPLNTFWKAADYQFVLADSRASVVIISAALLPQIEPALASAPPSLRHVVVADGDAANPCIQRWSELVAACPAHLEAERTSRDAPAFWLYSSGSTGTPKGCVHLHHDMAICADLFGKRVLGIRRDDRTFSVAKLFFAYGLGNALYFPFSVGATTILWPGPPAPAQVFDIIERHRPTIFYSVPTGYGIMLAHERHGSSADFDLTSIRIAVSAGEALPAPLFERFKSRFGIDILDGIGSTEVLHMFISNRPDAIRPGSSGLIVPGYEAKLVDDDNEMVAAGEIGHLLIAGDSICAGYWNQPEKTAQTINGSWIRTGDKYSQDADGFFWYAGRADDMLKVGGQWVSPSEVEHALLAHPSVLECGVVGRDDQDGLSKPMAFVVLRDGFTPSETQGALLRQFVRERLAEYKRPRWVRFLPELPKTGTGKIQRFKLRALARCSPA